MTAELDTIDKIECFLGDPGNWVVVSFTALSLHLNKIRACSEPGTVRFWKDLQDAALDRPWQPNTPNSEVLSYLNDVYCAGVRVDHEAFNARAVLVALNFYHFGLLKVNTGSNPDPDGWVGDPELGRQRNAVLRLLKRDGYGDLIPEIIRTTWNVERWFSYVPSPKASASAENLGPEARALETFDCPEYRMIVPKLDVRTSTAGRRPAPAAAASSGIRACLASAVMIEVSTLFRAEQKHRQLPEQLQSGIANYHPA